MDIETVVLYSELCRLCLDDKGVINLYTNNDLIQDIYLCTGVKVILSNNWPRKICTKCLEIVKKAKDLRLLATTSETRLKVLLENDDALQIDETLPSDADTIIVSPDIKDSFEKEDKEKPIKRHRSSSLENEAPAKKIAVRKDLFNSSTPLPTEGTYIEGTKYGISQRYTVNSKSDVTISYTCALCPKTFPTWKKVYCHQRLHNKHIPCTVESCEKKFSSKGDLEKHVRTHTGEKPFSCDICEKSFSQKSTLRVHREMVHRKKRTQKKKINKSQEQSDDQESCDQQEDSFDQQEENSDEEECVDQKETLVIY